MGDGAPAALPGSSSDEAPSRAPPSGGNFGPRHMTEARGTIRPRVNLDGAGGKSGARSGEVQRK